jgi:hypothetical protein
MTALEKKRNEMNFSFFSKALIFLCYFLCIKAKKVSGGNTFNS